MPSQRKFFLAVSPLLVFFLAVTALVWAKDVTPKKLVQTVKLNVFALVSPEIEDRVSQISEALKKSNLNTFLSKGYEVHCTLYMTRYPLKQQAAVVRLIASLAQDLEPFPVVATGLHITKGNWVFVNIEKNQDLRELADLIVKKLFQLRQPSSFVPNWVKYYPEKKANIAKYGSPNVFDQFEPHLTLLAKTDTKLLEAFLKKFHGSPLAKPIRGKITGIGVGIADGSGQIKTPLAIYHFPE